MSTSKRYAMPSKPTLLACAMASCLAIAMPNVFAQSTGATVRGQAASGTEVTAAATTTLEGVTVTANMLPEVKTSEVGATVSNKIISSVPQITRNFLEFADVVPGVAFSVDPGNGATKLQGGAQSPNAINVYIDGVGQKNYVTQGGITGQDSSRGNPFPQLGIGEYKVITQNYKAEYDQVSSAAITAVTKSGTNEFHGELFNQYTDQDWRAKTPAEANAGEKTDTQEKDYGVALGGPIIKDAMHFFFAYEAKDYVTPVTVVPGNSPGPLPPEALAQAGPTSIPFSQDLYFGKLDWTPSDSDLIELSGRYRKESQRDNIGGTQTPGFGSDILNNEKRADLRWQHTADRWLNDAHITWEDTEFGPQPVNNGIAQVYAVQNDNNRVLLQTGAGANFQNKGQKGPAIQDDLSFTDLQWMGDHLVKTGFKYKEVKLNTQEINPANPQFFYNVDESGADDTPYKAFFGVPLAGVGNGSAESKNKQFGIYLQDDWQVNEKLTLNLGVRWDYEETPSYLDYVTPPDVVAALRGWSNINNPNSGININDYISTGNNRDAPKDLWQPRLGFSYDLNADQEHVIFGGVGRSYDRDSFDYLQLEVSKATFPSYEVFFNQPGGPTCDTSQANCVNWDPSFYDINNLRSLVSPTGGGREIDLLNNNLKVPYSDQASIGMRNVVQLGPQAWNTSVTLSRIESKDGFAYILGNRREDGSFFGEGGQPWGFPLPGFGALILGKNGIESKANSLLFSMDKPYTQDSGWGVTVAYTYTDADENRKFGEHYALDAPDITDYPFLTSYGVSKHRLVATGILDGPWGTTFSSKLTLATPKPYSDIAFFGGPFGIPSAIDAPGTGRFLVGGKIFGTRSVDFAVNKDFDLTAGVVFYVRADLINAFNFKNYSDYTVNWGANGVYAPTISANTIGNMFTYPRLFKLSAGVRW